jgi:tetratricopeptide (TPR) repeat protein
MSPCSPLTWLTYAGTIDLFGQNPRSFHLISLILHLANSILLFYTLKKMTGAHWKSFIVAILFAIHPINVESVVWIAEVNNVLSGLFFMLTLITYHIYTQKPDYKRYLLVILIFELGLLSKQVLMTQPFILLLLDFWPLQRIQIEKLKNNNVIRLVGVPIKRLILEKIPLLILSFISFSLLLLTIPKHTTFTPLSYTPISLRIANALISYLKYLGKLFWPYNLGVLYPYPKAIPLWETIVAVICLIVITVMVLRLFQLRPYLLIGWLWFLGALVPFLGIVQSGLWPEMADRYAYIPFIGIFITLSWGFSDLVSIIRMRMIKNAVNVIIGIIICILYVSTWVQIGYWKDSITLYEHILKFNPNNLAIHGNLGAAFLERGEPGKAILHLNEVLRMTPDSATTCFDLGVAYYQLKDYQKALVYFRQALLINPNDIESYNIIVNIQAAMGKTNDAIKY